MILSNISLRLLKPVTPFVERSVHDLTGMSYGLSYAGYDIRIDQSVTLMPGEFILASSLEQFTMPQNVMGRVHDKSSWARQGLVVQNTILEPGWDGYLTLELTNHSKERIGIFAGSPIAQIVFEAIDLIPDKLYDGKYQNQKRGPQEALKEDGSRIKIMD